MNWYIKLLVIGFLLWDQNNVTSGDGPSENKTGLSPADQQASTTTVSKETPILTVSSPVALTSPVFSNVTTTTQAPTVTASMDLTSAFTAGPSSSNFTTPPESTQAMSVSPSTPGGELAQNCSTAEKSYKLNITVGQRNATFNWTNTEQADCRVFVNTSCTDNGTGTIIGDATGNIYGLKPYTNYSCNSSIFYNGKHIKTESKPIRTKVAEPELVQNLHCDGSIRRIDCRWDAPNILNGPLAGYIVTCDNCSTDQGFNLPANVQNHTFRNLEPSTRYKISIAAYVGESGDIAFGKNVTKVVLTKDKPGLVPNFNCNATNITIDCRWDAPDMLNLSLAGYTVTCDKCLSDRQIDLKAHVQNQTFNNLTPFTIYGIKIAAFVEEYVDRIYGDYTPITHRTTTEGIPSVVRNVNASVSTHHNNQIKITCREPEFHNGDSGSYILMFDGQEERHNEKCIFTIQDLSYLTTYKYKIYYKNKLFNGPEVEREVTTGYNDKALIGFLAFLITITSLALIFVLIKIYKLQKKASSNNEDSIPLTNPDDEKQLLNIEPIPVEKLLETYKKKNADEGRLFLDEFQSIPRVFSKFSIKEARKPCNQVKNRYIDILPYDDNRVVLSEIHGEPGSDYINASYINGLKEPRKYIAAQGPKEETMTDFWRMIWEQKSTIIVMVTRCEEGNRNKCAQYWPSGDGETEEYGDIVVKITDQKFFPDYITRKLHVTHRREKTGRDITHIQFTVWPDHGVPDDPNLLLKLRRRVNALSNFFSGPIIVHCSAGVGRTGTYITIDSMLEGLEAEGRVDVYGYVVQLRRQRCLMVQVEFQYIFIHKALVEYNQFGETEVSMAELPLILNSLKKNDSPSEPSQLMCEFQRLPSYRNWRPQTTGHHQDNKDKNRFSSVVPYEFNRVQIKADEEPEQEVTEHSEMSSDDDSDNEDSVYINASHITGYWGSREIIAAQAPLENTLSEFWQMVFQKKVKAIVMLSAPNQENNENSCAPYWKQKGKSYDNILQVELTSEKSHGSYTERCFEIRHAKRKDIRKVSQFHYEQWGEAIPIETKELLDMINKIKTNVPAKRMEEQTRHDKSVPLIVHCSDGSQVTGTFSALWYLLESARVEGVIDVFQTVKNLRRLRSGIVSSFEQYEFLYDVMASTVPAQNGQIKLSNNQDKMEIENELGSKFPEFEVVPSSAVVPGEETLSKPKDDDTTTNGPSPAAFTDVTLRIDE